jgi:hypothetical protein
MRELMIEKIMSSAWYKHLEELDELGDLIDIHNFSDEKLLNAFVFSIATVQVF